MARRRAKRSPTAAERRDGYVNPYTGHGTSRDRSTATSFRPDVVADIAMVNLWRSDDLIARTIEALPTDAMRLGCQIKVGDQDGKETAEGLQQEADRVNAYERVKEAAQYERAYGGAALFPVIDGAVGDLEEPLDDYEDAIGEVTAIHVFEPRELVPMRWYTSVTSPKYRKPSVYTLYALSGASGAPLQPVQIHESRLIVFPGVRVSAQIQPGQRPGWGDNVGNKLVKVVSDFNLAWGSASALLQDFAQAAIQLDDLATILQKKNGEEILKKRVAMMDMFRSSFRAMLLDGKDKFSRTSTPISGMSDLMMQLAQRCAAAAGMPVLKFLGLSPTGLNANSGGDFTTRAWYDDVDGARGRYAHPVRRLIRLLALQNDGPCEGVEPDRWSIEWPPLWSPSEKERAETRFDTAQSDQIYFNMGAASSDDIAKSRWGGDSYSADMTIDWEARAAQAALDATALSEQDKAALVPDGEADPGDAAPGDDEPGPAEPNPPRASARKVKVAAHQRTIPADETEA